MSYKNNFVTNNTNLQTVLEIVNALPEANTSGSGLSKAILLDTGTTGVSELTVVANADEYSYLLDCDVIMITSSLVYTSTKTVMASMITIPETTNVIGGPFNTLATTDNGYLVNGVNYARVTDEGDNILINITINSSYSFCGKYYIVGVTI